MKNLENFYELIFENLLLEAPLTLKAILSAEKQPKLYVAAKKAYEKLMLSNMTEDPAQLKMIEDPNAEAMLNPELLSFKKKIFEISPTGVGFDFIFKMLSRNDYENTPENIRRLITLVDMSVRSVSYKKNIVFLNELIESMLIKQEQINQKEKQQIVFKRFDPAMPIFSKIENYYDLYENLKKYYESGNDNLINAFITMDINNNFKIFLAKDSYTSAAENDMILSAASEGIFSKARNKDFTKNIKKYFSGNFEPNGGDTYMSELTTFAGYYVPFINYCIENKLFTEIKPDSTNKDIKLFLLKTYDAVVCSCNIYPKDFIKSLDPKTAEKLATNGANDAQYASHVDVNKFVMPKNNTFFNTRGVAEWCVKSPQLYSSYTSEKFKHFLLILDNTVASDKEGNNVFLTRVEIDDAKKIAIRAREFMNFNDKQTNYDNLSPGLQEIYRELLLNNSDNDNVGYYETCQENLYRKITTALSGKAQEEVAKISNVEQVTEFKLESAFNIDYNKKSQIILEENFLKQSDIIINDLRNIQDLNVENMFEYIFNFIEQNILDNDKIRFFGLLLKSDELGININCFNINEMLTSEKFIVFIQKMVIEYIPDIDFILLNYVNSPQGLAKFKIMHNRIQTIYNKRLEIEILQSINSPENLFKIIDELYFMDYFKDYPEVIKEYFSINKEQKLLAFKQDILKGIKTLNDRKKSQSESNNIFTKIFNFKYSEFQKVNSPEMLNFVSENCLNLIINNFNYQLNVDQDRRDLKIEKFLKIFNENLKRTVYNLLLDKEIFKEILKNIEVTISFIQNLLRFYMENKNKLSTKDFNRIGGITGKKYNTSIKDFEVNEENETELANKLINFLEKILNSSLIKNSSEDNIKKICIIQAMNTFQENLFKTEPDTIKNDKLIKIRRNIDFNLQRCLSSFELIFDMFLDIKFFYKNTIQTSRFIDALIYATDTQEYKNFESTMLSNLNNANNNSNNVSTAYENIDRSFNDIFYFLESRLRSNIDKITAFLNALNLTDVLEILNIPDINMENVITDPELHDMVITQINQKMQQNAQKKEDKKNAKSQKQDGFFKKMFKKWFLEGIEYQRINQRKILISESELKKLIKQNLL